MAQKNDSKATPQAPIAKAGSPAEVASEGGSLLRWFLGWVLLPGAVVGAIFGSGVLVGVHFSESWLTRAIVWVVRLFVA